MYKPKKLSIFNAFSEYPGLVLTTDKGKAIVTLMGKSRMHIQQQEIT